MDFRVAIAAVLAATSMAATATTAVADTDVSPGDTYWQVHQNDHAPGESAPESVDYDGVSPSGTYHSEQMCGGSTCTVDLTCPDGTPKIREWLEAPNGTELWSNLYCPGEAEGPPQVTAPIVAAAFQRIPLPALPLIIQPPNGRTLINFDTNFYTRERSLSRTVTLLGQRVELDITVHSYQWRFGDGATMTTDEPGAPYPRLQVSHDYREPARYRPSLATVWQARFRVGGGPWQAVPGTVTIAGAPESLRAVEARPILVG